MNTFLKNNGMTLALLSCVIIGGVCGFFFGGSVRIVKPVGDIFLNLVFMLVVPLVFFSISSSLCKMSKSGTLAKVLGVTAIVFVLMSIVAGIVAYLSTVVFNPLGDIDRESLSGSLFDLSGQSRISTADAIVSTVSVPDFNLLFTKANLLPLIVFSALLGLAVSMTGDKGKPIADFLESGAAVTMKMMGFIMYIAPVGLGCFFAVIISSVGPQILGGFLRVFCMYLVLTVIFFFVINSIYVLAAGGKSLLKAYWRSILPPSLLAMATTSSIVAIPGNIAASIKMGADQGIAEAVIPLGTNIHKDGSVIGGVIKVIFLMSLCGRDLVGIGPCVEAVVIAVLAGVVMGAVPSGGMTGEILTCTLLGVDPQMAGIIIVIGTIVDMPATMLNSSSNVVSALIVDSLVCGRTHSRTIADCKNSVRG